MIPDYSKPTMVENLVNLPSVAKINDRLLRQLTDLERSNKPSNPRLRVSFSRQKKWLSNSLDGADRSAADDYRKLVTIEDTRQKLSSLKHHKLYRILSRINAPCSYLSIVKYKFQCEGSIIIAYNNYKGMDKFYIKIKRLNNSPKHVIETYCSSTSDTPFFNNSLLATIRDDFSVVAIEKPEKLYFRLCSTEPCEIQFDALIKAFVKHDSKPRERRMAYLEYVEFDTHFHKQLLKDIDNLAILTSSKYSNLKAHLRNIVLENIKAIPTYTIDKKEHQTEFFFKVKEKTFAAKKRAAQIHVDAIQAKLERTMLFKQINIKLEKYKREGKHVKEELANISKMTWVLLLLYFQLLKIIREKVWNHQFESVLNKSRKRQAIKIQNFLYDMLVRIEKPPSGYFTLIENNLLRARKLMMIYCSLKNEGVRKRTGQIMIRTLKIILPSWRLLSAFIHVHQIRSLKQ